MNTDQQHIILSTDEKEIWSFLEEINDPEIPVLSIVDLGIVRDVVFHKDEVEVIITPTYTGCPAMDHICTQIRIMLLTLGFKKVKITTVLSPPWTTGWLSEKGIRKLQEYGIAPPEEKMPIPQNGVECPLCHSHNSSD